MSSRITPEAYEQAGITLHLQFQAGTSPCTRSTRGYPHNRPNCFIVSNRPDAQPILGAKRLAPLRRAACVRPDERSSLNAKQKSIFAKRIWWSQTDSNRRHPACKAGALPTELWPHSRTKLKPWLAWTDSNCRPYAYQAYALTT